MLAIATHMPMRNLLGSMASSRVKPGGHGSSPPDFGGLPPPPEPRRLAPAPRRAPLTAFSEVTVVRIVKWQSEKWRKLTACVSQCASEQLAPHLACHVRLLLAPPGRRSRRLVLHHEVACR